MEKEEELRNYLEDEIVKRIPEVVVNAKLLEGCQGLQVLHLNILKGNLYFKFKL